MRRGLVLAALAGCAGEVDVVDTSGGTPAEVDRLSGEELFALGCARCHGEDGRGGPGGPDLADRAVGLTVDELAAVVLEGSGAMAPVPFSEAEALDVATFVLDTLSSR